MRTRHKIALGLAALAVLLSLVVWQVSLRFDYAPANTAQTVAFWAISTLVFLLTVLLGFLLFRTAFKLYLERQALREGSRIKFKLVFGAIALSLLPVAFLVAFSYAVLNRTVEKWFSRPAEGIRINLIDAAVGIGDEVQDRADALANWLVTVPAMQDGTANFAKVCLDNRIFELRIVSKNGELTVCEGQAHGQVFTARAALDKSRTLIVRLSPRVDLAAKQTLIQGYVHDYDELAANKRNVRNLYLMFLLLIALFILFVSTWIALVLSRHIVNPITALLEAASQIRRGNLGYRVNAGAIDELATLVRAFNEMTTELEGNSRELENRRRFTEAILENIPTGVISLDPQGRIRRVNSALKVLLGEDRTDTAMHFRELFPSVDAREFRHLMQRSVRTGSAAMQVDIESSGQVRHLSINVSALPSAEHEAQGFVVVVEDTTEMLRAQKSEAWHEVARRIAHELKNPLTPIALSAQRIARHLERSGANPDAQRILRQCAETISREVESVKSLADEFSQLSRFPAAQLAPCDMNRIVRNGLDVFAGRLDPIDIRTDLAEGLPLVLADAEHLKRVLVNLVDNAAEAMQESLTKRLFIGTRLTSADTVELLVADTGPGISAADKEKLFLPYFSTKGRGTGLGLAIVSHIVAEHGGRIRVEDNRPTGTRFFVEVPVAVVVESESGVTA